MKKYLSPLFFFFFMSCLYGQKIEINEVFKEKLNAVQVDFFVPLEASYKDVPTIKAAEKFQTYDFAIRSKKEKLEIRYLVHPIEDNDLAFLPPSANFMRILTHLASNDEEHLIAVHSMSSEALKTFGTDWGKEAVFTPKGVFSEKKHCKMLMLHKEGRGNIFLFFLFDEASEAIDARYYALKFKDIVDN